jgi:hypothetical protein
MTEYEVYLIDYNKVKIIISILGGNRILLKRLSSWVVKIVSKIELKKNKYNLIILFFLLYKN